MGRNGLLIGDLARLTGASRQALRLYEQAAILPPAARTSAGYRVYGPEMLALVTFVRQTQRLGFTLDEIKEIVAIRRAGRTPCAHVRALVGRKAAELDRRLRELKEVRRGLRTLLDHWGAVRPARGAVCSHIERSTPRTNGEKSWNT